MKTESDVEAEARKLVESKGGRLLKLQLFNERGFPDRTILMPHGRMVFAEFKHPNGGSLSPHQKRWFRKLERMGYEVRLVRKIEDLDL